MPAAVDESFVVPYRLSELPSARRVLVLAPHPDDEVYGCGGAIALHVAAGAEVRVVLATAGDQNAGQSDAAYARDRLAESAAAARELGIPPATCWALPDRGVQYDEETVRRIVDLLEVDPPEVVYAPAISEPHPDHRALVLCALEAIRRSVRRPVLMLYEVGTPTRANFLLDVSAVWSTKAGAMACFASQEARLQYAEFIGALNRYRALTVSDHAQRVEAFVRMREEDIDRAQFLLLDSERHEWLRRGSPRTPSEALRVSVIVRSAGRASVQRALHSIHAQTLAAAEILVVDVAARGADEIVAVCGAAWNSRCRVVTSGAALGRAAAANAGLDQALGEACLFLDDDDWLYPDHLAKLAAALIEMPDAGAAHTAVECVNDSGQPVGQVFDHAYQPGELIFGNFLPIHSVLFRASLAQGGCRFDEQFDLYEDWDFWLQVDSKTAFRFVPGVSAAYRINASSGAGVHAEQDRALKATAQIFRKWGVGWGEKHFPDLIRRALHKRELERQLVHAQGRMDQIGSELARIGREFERASEEAAQQQLQALDAMHDADKARSDAAHYRAAHESACTARDLALGAREQAERDLHAALVSASHWQTAAQTATHSATRLEEALGQARLQLDQARAQREQLEMAHRATAEAGHAAAALAQFRQAQIDELIASRSWRLTRPLRELGGAVRKVRNVRQAWQAQRARGRSGWFLIRRAASVFSAEGLPGVRSRVRRILAASGPIAHEALQAAVPSDAPVERNYATWVRNFDTVDQARLDAWRGEERGLSARPLVSIVMPVYRPKLDDIRRAIESVKSQVYERWELCICDDASADAELAQFLADAAKNDPRVRVTVRPRNGHIAAATNDAIAMASGDWVAFLDQDDEVRPHAVLRLVQTAQRSPGAAMIYSDEDKIDAAGVRFDPYFKTDFNLGLLRSHNYACHFLALKRSLIDQLGGLRADFNGAQDYDLVLRAVDALDASQIGHVPEVLYHWRAGAGSTASGVDNKSYAFVAGQRALAEHLSRRLLDGLIEGAPEAPGMYRVRWNLPASVPLVSIIIPTRNGFDLVRQCLDSLRTTAYPNFEVIVVDNGSDDPKTLELLQERARTSEIRVIRDNRPFNFSALNNFAVRTAARGEFVLLLNNDVEVIDPGWLGEMVGPALEPGVGCVGARLWYPNETLQHAGVIMVCGVAGHAHKYLPRGQHGYMGRAVLAQDFLAVTAACLLVRREIFDEVGGLDESLAVAFNDVDFCLRVHSKGYRNHWTPYASLIHHESLTRGYEDTPEKQARFSAEVATLQSRWRALIDHDPCYSPNLTNQSEDFSLAWPPRVRAPAA